MAKTYRALGVTAIVMLVGLLAQAMLLNVEAQARASLQLVPGLATGPAGGIYAWLLAVMWPLTVRTFTPIISTFAAVAAAQSRQWAWFAVMLITGLVGVWGAAVLFAFPRLTILSASPTVNFVIVNLVIEVIPPAIPALAALVFAWLSLRAGSSAQRGTAQPA